MSILRHPLLGSIRGKILGDLTQYSGIPYASIPHRFARSTTLTTFPTNTSPYDATETGPESIQSENGTEVDAEANQFPHKGWKEQIQSEDCLVLNITTPTSSSASTSVSSSSASLPVVVFVHGGAFFLGSSTRPYYSPTNFLHRALSTNHPLIFVSINYRLGALGFLHSPTSEVSDILPPNNALHDQLRAFDWIHRNISGFGGDPSRITALGQSAGGMSLSLHSISANPTPLFGQMICLSGSPVTMPSKTRDQYQETFISLAKKIGIENVERKTDMELAREFMDAPVRELRDLGYVGSPCTQSEIVPYDHPTMAMTRGGPSSGVKWLKRAIYSSTTFDGSVSYNMLAKIRKGNARTFIEKTRSAMTTHGADSLLDLYGIREDTSDLKALEKICQFESDIGFFFASHASVQGSPATKRYLQVFDLANPFDDGGSSEKGKFATHTWDIVALLGCFDDSLDERVLGVVGAWRDRIVRFICEEEDPWDAWDDGELDWTGAGAGKALRVDKEGIRVVDQEETFGEDGGRRRRLLGIAEGEKGEDGCDFLWEGVCRNWLDG